MRRSVPRTAVLGLLALLPAGTRADVGVGLRHVPVHVTLAVDRDYPEFAFFLVGAERHAVRRVSPTAAGPVVAWSGDAGGSFFQCAVYVVPNAELGKFDRATPPAPWFEEKEHLRYRAGQIHVRPILDAFDNRDRVEQAYRVRQAGDAFRLDLESENRGSPWVKGVRGGFCCVLPAVAGAVALALGGVWLGRRGDRKNRAQRRPPER